MNLLKIVVVLALTISAALAQTLMPQGRLTPQSNAPVMNQEITAGAGSVSQIYYTPYVGNNLPQPNGSGGYTNSTFSQLTLGFNSSYTLDNNIYDIFAYYSSGSWSLCTGPAWSSLTSRGSGAGTTQIAQVGGVWVNANSMTCYVAAGGFTVPANMGVYLGSAYMTGNGSTTMRVQPAATALGTNSLLGLYNAYNRVSFKSICQDSTASWTYTTSTWRAADGSNDNRIWFLDGLQQSFINATYQDYIYAGSSSAARIGVNLDSTSGTPGGTVAGPSIGYEGLPLVARNVFYPQLGFHYVQAMEYGFSGGTTVTLYGQDPVTGQEMSLFLDIEM